MRAVKFILLSWLLGMLALWIRDGRGFCLLEALPFVERNESFSREYEWLAVAAVLIGLWGVLMLSHRVNPQSQLMRRRRVFRSEIVLVPVTVIALAAITKRLKPGLTFSDVVGHSPKTIEHIYLAVLSVAVFAAVLAVKWCGNDPGRSSGKDRYVRQDQKVDSRNSQSSGVPGDVAGTPNSPAGGSAPAGPATNAPAGRTGTGQRQQQP